MNHRAFTLVETVVVVAVTALISLTLGMLLVYFYKTNAYTLEQSTAVTQARQGVESAMRNFREASYGSDGSYPIAAAATSSITFYANIDTDSAIEQVTYTFWRGVLYRAVSDPSGNPFTYAGAAVATSTVATSVVNTAATPMFRYFDTNGAELTAPVDISKVVSITTTLLVDVNINRAPTTFSLSGSATLRSFRTQL